MGGRGCGTLWEEWVRSGKERRVYDHCAKDNLHKEIVCFFTKLITKFSLSNQQGCEGKEISTFLQKEGRRSVKKWLRNGKESFSFFCEEILCKKKTEVAFVECVFIWCNA
jgi:hypothetical protein